MEFLHDTKSEIDIDSESDNSYSDDSSSDSDIEFTKYIEFKRDMSRFKEIINLPDINEVKKHTYRLALNAIKSGKVNLLKEILKNKIIDIDGIVNESINDKKFTLFYYACQNNQFQFITLLLNENANQSYGYLGMNEKESLNNIELDNNKIIIKMIENFNNIINCI